MASIFFLVLYVVYRELVILLGVLLLFVPPASSFACVLAYYRNGQRLTRAWRRFAYAAIAFTTMLGVLLATLDDLLKAGGVQLPEYAQQALEYVNRIRPETRT